MAIEKDKILEFINAAVQDPPTAIRLLRETPELRNARWLHEETTLHFLAVEGRSDAVRLLARLGFDPNVPNKFGDPPLIDVATLGNDEVAEALLDAGGDPNGRSETRDCVLHCAVASGNARLVRRLLAAGAKAEYITDTGETVFDVLPNDPDQRAAVESVLREHGIKKVS